MDLGVVLGAWVPEFSQCGRWICTGSVLDPYRSSINIDAFVLPFPLIPPYPYLPDPPYPQDEDLHRSAADIYVKVLDRAKLPERLLEV